MKILVVTSYYWPEPFRITDLVAGLKDRGHSVVVLTAQPNYPGGSLFNGYGLRGPYRQEHEGVPVLRVPIVPRGKGGAVGLVLNYLSFAVTGSLRALELGRCGWDVVFVMQLSPVTVILPAIVIRTLYRVPVVTWSQDLWPESIAAAGFARSRLLFGFLRGVSGWLYRRCDRILASSPAFQPRLEALGVRAERFSYLPQWAEEIFSAAAITVPQQSPHWAAGFPVMFAGNLGRVQALDTILQAAELLQHDREVKWVFLGEGVQREWLAEEARRRGLGDRVFLLGHRPIEELPAFYARAAVLLVSLKPDDAMALTIPAKVQSYLAAGRPIIGSLDGEGAQVIRESGSGWAAPAGDPRALADLVSRMKALPAAEREKMGQRGRSYCTTHFSRVGCLDQLERALQEAASASIL